MNLAHKLEFKEVKELAVRELHLKKDLALVEKMALYQQHRVDERHLVPLFAELCARDTPLTLDESKILGPDSTYLVYSTRERLRALPSYEGRSPLPEGMEDNDVFRAIESFFELDHGSTLAFQQENGTGTLVTLISISRRVYINFNQRYHGERKSSSYPTDTTDTGNSRSRCWRTKDRQAMISNYHWLRTYQRNYYHSRRGRYYC